MMKTAVQVVRGIAPIALALGVVLAGQVVMPWPRLSRRCDERRRCAYRWNRSPVRHDRPRD